MAVYIDGKGCPNGALNNGPKWHMFTDGDARELHDLAQGIGLRRQWYQDMGRAAMHPHYDVIGQRLYMEAVKAGAIEVAPQEGALIRWRGREQ